MTYIADLFIKQNTNKKSPCPHTIVIVFPTTHNEIMNLDIEELEQMEDEIEAMLDEIRAYRKRHNIVYGE